MGEASEGQDRQPAFPPTRWPVVRLVVDFLLDIAELSRDGGPLLDALILIVVTEANLAPLGQDARLERTYAGLASPPPEALLRPVSVSAAAGSLGLPYETVRRRLARLAAAGLCGLGPKGVVISAERLASPDYMRIISARYERTRRLYHDLRAAGVSDVEPDPAGERWAPFSRADPPVRLCERVLAEYHLRTTEIMMRRLGDPLTGVIGLGLARANMVPLGPEARAATYVHPETARRPVPRSALAAQLGLPAETVRRRLIDFERRGFCRATPRGVLLDAEMMFQPERLQLFRENEANVARLLARLRRYGVLDLWDAEALAA